jgi:hypothetical protein
VRLSSTLRRLASFLAMIGLVLGWAETGVADVHDGDAEPAGAAVFAAAAAAAPPAPADAPANPAPGHTSDSPHTCHCIHVHGTGLPVVVRFHPWHSVVSSAPGVVEPTPISVSPEPLFRPPVR